MSQAIKITVNKNCEYEIEYLTQHFAQHEDLSTKIFKRDEILKIIEMGKYQFVLLDYSGNEDEGQKLLKNIKLKVVKTPIVIFTNPDNDHNIVLTQNEWMLDKTGKSEDSEELINLIDKFIKKSKDNK